MYPAWNQWNQMNPAQSYYQQNSYGWNQYGTGTPAPAPAPPAEPQPPVPVDEKPPLPPEPPPPESAGESQMNALKQQAQQWQQQQQQQQQWQQQQQQQQWWQQQQQQQQQSQWGQYSAPAPPQPSAPWPAAPPPPPPPEPVNSDPEIVALDKEEKEFLQQYDDWMAQYAKWRDDNKNHPNREQYMQYEQTWRTYETQMEAKKHELQQRRQQLMSKKSAPPLPPPASANAATPATYSHGAVQYSNPVPGASANPRPYGQPPVPQQQYGVQPGAYGMPPSNAPAGYGGYNAAADNNKWGAEEQAAVEQYDNASSWQSNSDYGQQQPPQGQYPSYGQQQGGDYGRLGPRFNGAGGPPHSNYPPQPRPGFDGNRQPRPPHQYPEPRPGSDVVNSGMRFGARGDGGMGPRPRLPGGDSSGGVKSLFREGTIRPLFPEGTLRPPRPDGNQPLPYGEGGEEEDYGFDEDFLSVPREHAGGFGNGPGFDNGSSRGRFDAGPRGALRPRFPGPMESRPRFAGSGDIRPRFDDGSAYGEPANKQPRMSSTRGGRGSRWGPVADAASGGKPPAEGAIGNDSENQSFSANLTESFDNDEPDFSQDFGDDVPPSAFGGYQSFEDSRPRPPPPSQAGGGQRFPGARGPVPPGPRPSLGGPAGARGGRFPPPGRGGGAIRPLIPGLGSQARGGFRPQGGQHDDASGRSDPWADQGGDYEHEETENADVVDGGRPPFHGGPRSGPLGRPRFPPPGGAATRGSWAAPARGRGGFDGRGPMPLRFRGRAEGVQFFQGKGDGNEEVVKDEGDLAVNDAENSVDDASDVITQANEQLKQLRQQQSAGAEEWKKGLKKMPPLPALRPVAPLPRAVGPQRPPPPENTRFPRAPRSEGPTGGAARFPGPRSDGPGSRFPGSRASAPGGLRGGRGFRHSAPFAFDDFREERLKIMREIVGDSLEAGGDGFGLPFARDEPKPLPAPAQVFDYSHGRSADSDNRSSALGNQDHRQNSFASTVMDYGHGIGSGKDEDFRRFSEDVDERVRPTEPRPFVQMESFDYGHTSARSTDPYASGDRLVGLSTSLVPPLKVEEKRSETILVDDLLCQPGRQGRPDRLVVIVRGPPGSGKSYVSRLIRDKEVANGGATPRMLCLDDYFMVEAEKVETDADTGKKVKKTVMEYEYDAALEDSYRKSFMKSFKKHLDDGYFSFMIVDAMFDNVRFLEEFWSYAMSKGFQVYVADVITDLHSCLKRNIHNRDEADIREMIDSWDDVPRHIIRLDIRNLLQEVSITEVEMEDSDTQVSGNRVTGDAETGKSQDDEDDEKQDHGKSKWDLDTSEGKLDKLDGLNVVRKHHATSPKDLDSYLQLSEDDEVIRKDVEPGKKRVRWADIEERKSQAKMRNLGFVVGQTNWAKMTDDSSAERALLKTKYI